MFRIFDSISTIIVVSSDGQSPSKFLIIGLRLARLVEFDGNCTPSLETRRMSFEISLDRGFSLLGNALLFNLVAFSVTTMSLGEKCFKHNLGPVIPGAGVNMVIKFKSR